MPIPSHLESLNDNDLLLAARAADEAGRIIRDGYGKRANIRAKGIGDLVSEIDEKADQVISQMIRIHKPTDSIVSEELQPDASHIGTGRTWFVDPLDGTAAFLFRVGTDVPSVLIALAEGDVFKLGIIHFPLTGAWFYALRDHGAYHDGEQLLAKEAPTLLSEAWVEMNHYGDSRYESPAFALLRERLRQPGGACLVTTPVPHSGLAMKLFGAGPKLGAIIHDNNPAKLKQGPWDTAAPQAIVEAAGGAFLNLTGERYNLREPQPLVIAANPAIAKAIVTLAAVPSS